MIGANEPEPKRQFLPSEEALEFPSLLALIAGLAVSDLGAERIWSLGPARDEEDLLHRRRLFEECRQLAAVEALVPVQESRLSEVVARLMDPKAELAGRDLLTVGQILAVTSQVARRAGESETELPLLLAMGRALPDLADLGRSIAKALDRRGRVRDNASPQLETLRAQVNRLRSSLYRRLEKAKTALSGQVSEDTISFESGRLVLLLRAGASGAGAGLIHGRSATGKSVYFEPLDAVEDNNSLRSAIGEEEAERERILAELVAECRRSGSLLQEHFDFLATLDQQQAIGRWADMVSARQPEISARHELRLVAARHPLLDPGLAEQRREILDQAGHTGEVIPLDLEFDPEKRLLVVTGPNAGGKTVALKTLGLLSLAAQCGVPIPCAAGTRIPRLATVLALVGDEQDLLADRSTFSGRLQRLREIWQEAGPDTLVLIDELGAGTDPEEGAALGTALLEGLLEMRTLALMTTHLSTVAAAALERNGAASAAMEFDSDTGRPTFRLLSGSPGGSQALALARRLGLPSAWLDRAEELLGTEHRDLRRLLREVERVRKELVAEQGLAETETRRLASEREKAVSERQRLEEERAVLDREVRAEIAEFRRDVRKRLRTELTALRGEVERGRKRGLDVEATERLFADPPQVLEEPEPENVILKTGMRVKHRSQGWEGEIRRLEGDRAEITVHGKRVLCGVDELRPSGEDGPSRSKLGGLRKTEVEFSGEVEIVPVELNLVGERVEPALEKLERFMDGALLSDHAEVRLIHGHGSGRLRKAIRQALKAHPAVDRMRAGGPGEGGDGATIAVLKK